jgi:lysophospholipase L1-like esterase
MAVTSKIIRYSDLARRAFANLMRPAWAEVIRPHHYLHFELVPNYRSADGRITHNSLGYRGSEFSPRKKAGVTRIVCLGESTTYCGNLADAETWPSRLAVHLSKDLEVEVINAGVPAYVASEMLLSFIFKIEGLMPDWLVLYCTITDAAARRVGDLSRDLKEFCRPWVERGRLRSLGDVRKLAEFGASIVYRVRRLSHGDFPQSRILDGCPDVFRENIRDIVALAVSRGISVLLVCPRFRRVRSDGAGAAESDPLSFGVAQNRAVMKAIGEEFGQPVLDMIELMPPPPCSVTEPSDYYYDSVHMKPAGADLFAHHVSRAILARTTQRTAPVQAVRSDGDRQPTWAVR